MRVCVGDAYICVQVYVFMHLCLCAYVRACMYMRMHEFVYKI